MARNPTSIGSRSGLPNVNRETENGVSLARIRLRRYCGYGFEISCVDNGREARRARGKTFLGIRRNFALVELWLRRCY